jgi:hypothetical protein
MMEFLVAFLSGLKAEDEEKQSPIVAVLQATALLFVVGFVVLAIVAA